jgi:alkaline phosphatase D
MNRVFLIYLTLLSYHLCSQSLIDRGLSGLFIKELYPFYYGVASGDPSHESILLWTKLHTDKDEDVLWEIALDSLFTLSIQSGIASAEQANDFTVLVDVGGLTEQQTYYYRFRFQNHYSITGRCRTLPKDKVSELKILVMSCSNFEAGYFNAYKAAAMINDIDVVLFLGDYIYEYPPGKYGKNIKGRSHLPAKEIISLEDYRMRFGQYRLDPDLQRIHARHSFITIWDDHESANDAYKDGAQNHQPETEGSWTVRRDAAMKAYYEWLPVKKNDGKLYRHFNFGNLVDLWMLEERHEARSQQAKSISDPSINDENRALLGAEQLAWLAAGMNNSEARWKVIGNQVILSTIDARKVLPENPKNMDMWDGYPAEKNRLFSLLNNFDNTIVVSGDSHTSWAFELTAQPNDTSIYDAKLGKGVLGAEFAAPSVTSANFDEYVKRWKARIGAKRFIKDDLNPHVKFCNVTDHGFVLLTLTHDRAVADWYFVKHLTKPSAKIKKAASYQYDGKNVRKK